jgi:membrane protease subunit (stomatin/prohibitin family)
MVFIVWQIVAVVAGAVLGGLLITFWDEIKQWAEQVLGYILDAINTAIEVTSDAFVFLIEKGTRYYKRVEVFVRNVHTNMTRSKVEEEEVSEYDLPDKVKEQLNARTDKKLKLMQRPT